MSRHVVPSWQCERCARWTPHGRYNCQHCGSKQPQWPELGMRAPDGSLPPPDEQPEKGARAAPADMAALLSNAGYDDLVRD